MKKPIAATVCSVVGTILLALVIVVCIPLTVPRIAGYQIYTVISGSMEPAIPTGSLVYVRNTAPSGIEKGDVIAFYGSLENGSIITCQTTVYPVSLSPKGMRMQKRIWSR